MDCKLIFVPMEPISSLQNPFIKQLQKLDKNRERKKQNVIPVEGLRECKLAVEGGFSIEKVVYCSEYISEFDLKKELNLSSTTHCIDTTPAIFNALVYRKGIANCLALIRPINYHFSDLDTSKNLLLLVVDSVEKPGNLGAMLRTCDAAGIDAIIVCDAQTDIYNPNCIRASLGAVFTKKTIVSNAEACINWLKNNSIQTLITYLESARNYTLENYTHPTAIVVGSEAYGIKEEWLKSGFKNIIIPQVGKVDSMNVANSAAIIIYEAIRQRNLSRI
jgi:TrmH family RNA methyltransferase